MYKAVNTMDSMIGYKNDKYMYFGRFAAKSDDVVNFIPARLASWIMIAATGVVQIFSKDKKYNMKDALRIYRRDIIIQARIRHIRNQSVPVHWG